MPVRPMLLHRMGLVSFRLFCKNLGNLQEFFGQMVYRPPWPKIARTPMPISEVSRLRTPSCLCATNPPFLHDRAYGRRYTSRHNTLA